ncbi:hypothetical protein M5X17_27800 [Paenibacillus alvei]|uniref:hypothetical protein n=1 Tax=Paenibacillus alvei TaxID=44250 RepID=UPI00227EAC02|nr:hypothetical protein [Paenibacillus alvei]MCY9737511.1 hypothetical protein [Paenibacillus alvei]
MPYEELEIEVSDTRCFIFKVEEVVKVKSRRMGNIHAVREIEGKAMFDNETLLHLSIDNVRYENGGYIPNDLTSKHHIEKDKKMIEKDVSFLALIKKMFRFKNSNWIKSKNDN